MTSKSLSEKIGSFFVRTKDSEWLSLMREN